MNNPPFPGIYAGLRLGLLLIACIVGLQVSYFLRQAARSLELADQQLAATGTQAQLTLLRVQAVLGSAYQTSERLRRAAEDQIAYYDKVGRRAGQVLDNLYVLTARADERMERATRSLETAAGDFSAVSDETAQQVSLLGREATALLAESRQTVRNLGELTANPALAGSAAHLEQASAEIAQASRNTAEATGYIRDMLSPTKKSFWRRMLELMIPRPAIAVK